MSFYESVFIARQDISASQVDALADQFATIIKDGGGNVTKKEYWGLKTLAYRIKKNRKGHYTLFNIDAPSSAVLEMERNMLLQEDVLRYLTIKVEELEEGPSVLMRGRGDRGDRGDRFDRGGRGARPGRRTEGDRSAVRTDAGKSRDAKAEKTSRGAKAEHSPDTSEAKEPTKASEADDTAEAGKNSKTEGDKG
ncbi:MAG: 30S ribosomal protein S6 [Proteobacteria bacterium]|nr:30S ribosomal protein S6 [Pseudomonadota bacterium]